MPNDLPEILIVEDDMVAIQILEPLLQKLGHPTRVARDGSEGWDIWSKRKSAIIVSDWEMPEMTGLDLVKKIRGNQAATYTYFICVTARKDAADRVAAMDAGVDDFLTKPLNEQELITRLRVALRILNFQREIDALKDVLPICSYCKNVRQDEESWEKLEVYIERNFNTDISHSICPNCYKEVIDPQFEAMESLQAITPAYKKTERRLGDSGSIHVVGAGRFNHSVEIDLSPDDQMELEEALLSGVVVLQSEGPVAVFGGVFSGRVISKTPTSICIGGADHTFNRSWANRPKVTELRARARDGRLDFSGGVTMEIYEHD